MLRRFLVRYVYGLVAWTIFLAVSALTLVVGTAAQLLARPFDPRRRVSLWVLRQLWGRLLFALEPGFPVRRDGLEHLGEGPYVLVANHSSVLDIPACMGLPLPLRIVAKATLFRVPVLGWMMRLSGQIPLARAGLGPDLDETLAACRRTLAEGTSVLFFPEGTRSPDGRPRRFRRGAFRIALDLGVPVLPVAVYGAHHTLSKGSAWPWRLYAPIAVRVLPPIDPAGVPTARALSNRAHAALVRAVDELAAEVDARGWGFANPRGGPEPEGAA